MGRKRSVPGFEKALEELERLVARMEDGELSLEDSLKTYEQGVELGRLCQRALDDAEQKVRVLTDKDLGEDPDAADPATPGQEEYAG